MTDTMVRFDEKIKAFTLGKEEMTRIMVDEGVVKVWDNIAQHFTSCHSLSSREMARLRIKAKIIASNPQQESI